MKISWKKPELDGKDGEIHITGITFNEFNPISQEISMLMDVYCRFNEVKSTQNLFKEKVSEWMG